MQNNIKENIDLFISYLELEKNYSELTIRNYKFWLGRFADYIEAIENKIYIEQIEAMDITKFRSFLYSEWISIKTINYYIIALRSFFKYLHKIDIDTIAIEKIELSKIESRKITFLTEEEVKKILVMPEKFNKNNFKKNRDAVILHILYWSWLRVSELINLKKNEISFNNNQLNIVWKWKKERAVFITQKALEYIKNYLSLRNDKSDYLIISLSPNSYWRKISRVWIEKIVRDYASLAMIDKKVTPHTLRHSFATTLLSKWVDIRTIQTLLWHSSITTTQIYTHISDKYLQQAHSLLDNL